MMANCLLTIVLVTLVCTVLCVSGDTPANCTYEEVKGAWTFSVGKSGLDKNLDCTSFGENVSRVYCGINIIIDLTLSLYARIMGWNSLNCGVRSYHVHAGYEDQSNIRILEQYS